MPSFRRWRVWGLLLMVPLDPTEEPTIMSQYKASMERLPRLDDTNGDNDEDEDENLIAVDVDGSGSTKGVEPDNSLSNHNPPPPFLANSTRGYLHAAHPPTATVCPLPRHHVPPITPLRLGHAPPRNMPRLPGQRRSGVVFTPVLGFFGV